MFFTYETEETFWWESWLAPLLEQAGGEELRELVGLWQGLPKPRRDKLVEYARDQAELVRFERFAGSAMGDEEA